MRDYPTTEPSQPQSTENPLAGSSRDDQVQRTASHRALPVISKRAPLTRRRSRGVADLGGPPAARAARLSIDRRSVVPPKLVRRPQVLWIRSNPRQATPPARSRRREARRGTSPRPRV